MYFFFWKSSDIIDIMEINQLFLLDILINQVKHFLNTILSLLLGVNSS